MRGMSLAEDGQRESPGGKKQQQTPGGGRSLKEKSMRQSPRAEDPKNQGERVLRGKSNEELWEMLQRQQKLLENRSFINKLPDKGKRISDFAEKLKAAIAEHEELQRTTKMLSDFKINFQENINNLNKNKESNKVPNDHSFPMAVETKIEEAVENSSNSKDNDHNNGNTKLINSPSSDSKAFVEAQQLNTDELITGFQQVKIADEVTENEFSNKKTGKLKLKNTDPFLVPMHKKLHYIEVLENRAEHPITARQKFRPNHCIRLIKMKKKTGQPTFLPKSLSGARATPSKVALALLTDGYTKRGRLHILKQQLPLETLSGGSNESSHSSSPGQSPARIDSTMSAEEREMRDKHRSDFTSARVPPLHYMPAQLLPIEESVTLQMIQKVTYEEMQSKLAAQKLAERLNIKMVKYNPDDGASMKYREVRDEDYYSEDEI